MTRKSDTKGMGCLIVIAIIAYPFIWLYETLGSTLFWFLIGMVGLGTLLVMGMLAHEKEKSKRQSGKRKIHTYIQRDPKDGKEYVETDWPAQFAEIDRAISEGDYDFAREWLQRFAYTITGKDDIPQWVKDRFKQVMTEFASHDPLYRDVMERLLPMVQANPGMMQSQIYKGQPDDIKEQMRYVLYFAHELGHILRVKKGNSYRLYLPYVEDGAAADVDAAELHRMATQFKDARQWDQAIDCLQKAQLKMIESPTYWPIESWLRLPLFLQQAGRVDEALAQFEWLLGQVDGWHKEGFSHRPESVQQELADAARRTINEKIELAKRREVRRLEKLVKVDSSTK